MPSERVQHSHRLHRLCSPIFRLRPKISTMAGLVLLTRPTSAEDYGIEQILPLLFLKHDEYLTMHRVLGEHEQASCSAMRSPLLPSPNGGHVITRVPGEAIARATKLLRFFSLLKRLSDDFCEESNCFLR